MVVPCAGGALLSGSTEPPQERLICAAKGEGQPVELPRNNYLESAAGFLDFRLLYWIGPHMDRYLTPVRKFVILLVPHSTDNPV